MTRWLKATEDGFAMDWREGDPTWAIIGHAGPCPFPCFCTGAMVEVRHVDCTTPVLHILNGTSRVQP